MRILRTHLARTRLSAALLILCSFGAETAAGSTGEDARRIDVEVSFSGIAFDEKEITDGLGGGLSVTYHLPGPLSLQVSYGGGYEAVSAFQVGALWRFRRDKQFIPYLQAGYGIYPGREVSSFEDVTGCAVILLDCREELEDTKGPYVGAGFKAYITQDRRWFMGLNYRFFFLKEVDLITTRTFIVGSPTVTRQRVNPDGFMFQLGVGYSF